MDINYREKSFFTSQINKMDKQDKNIIKNDEKKNYILVDSSKRNKTNIVVSEKIDTIDDYIKIFSNNFDIIILNPKQLDINKSEIPKTISVIFNWVSVNKKNIPRLIFGINSREIIYNADEGGPVFQAVMVNYDYDTDRSYYRICDIKPKEIGYFFPKNRNGFLELRQVTNIKEGYPDPSRYKINLQNTYKNVVGINIKSSIFPIPNKLLLDNKTNNYVILDIPFKQIITNFDLDSFVSFNVKNTINDLTLKIRKKIKEHYIYPILSYFDNQQFFIKLLNLEIPQQDILNIEYYDEFYFLNYKKIKDFSFGSVIWINLNEKDKVHSGIYRIVDEYYHQVKVEYDITSIDNLKINQPLFKNKKFVGLLIKIDELNKNIIYISSPYENIFKISDILNNLDKSEVFTVSDTTIIGNNIYTICNKLCSLPDYKIKPDITGIFKPVKFKIYYDKCNILSKIRPVKNGYFYNFSNYINSIEINASIKSINELNYEISFSDYGLPDLQKFQIENILGEKVINPSNNNINHEISLVDKIDKSKTRLFLENKSSLRYIYPGTPVKCLFGNKNLECHVIDTVDNESGSVVINNRGSNSFKKEDSLIGINTPMNDIGIYNSLCNDSIIGNLYFDCMRNETKIVITTDKIFNKGFIIQIGLELTGDQFTNSELNVIEEIVKYNNNDDIDINEINDEQNDDIEGEDKTYLITLMYPLNNSWLAGCKITQKYLYLKIEKFIDNLNCLVSTDQEIDIINNCYGVINWLSTYLYDNEEDDEYLYEEEVYIDNIDYINESIYQVTFSKEIKHLYQDDEYYLVIFCDKEFNCCRPSTCNFNDNGKWFTKIYLDQPISMFKNDQYIQINGMTGENIPKYGLSSSDNLSRDILKGDVDLSEEFMNNMLVVPNSYTSYKIENYNEGERELDPFIVIKGRYFGRNGRIRFLREFNSLYLDVFYNKLITSNIAGFNTVYFRKSLLPQSLRKQISVDSQIKINVIPIDEKRNIYEKYQRDLFFYMTLPNISFIKDIPYEEKEYYCNGSLENKHLLNNIFNVIYIKNFGPGDDNLFDTFLYSDNSFAKNPIKQLDELELNFIWKNGEKVNFNNKDHSFILEIIEEDGSLQEINSRTGKIK